MALSASHTNEKKDNVIDCHVHVTGKGMLPEWLQKHHRFQQRFPSGILSSMDKLGIDKSVLLALNWERVLGKGYKITNEYISELVGEHPDRFIGFASVDPLEGEKAARELENAVKKLGLKGLKLHTVCQHFYPDDRIIYPVYETAEKLGIPLMIHVGALPPQATTAHVLRYKHCNPLYLDDVVRDFPNLSIIIPHLGAGFFKEAFMLARTSKKIYFDTSDADLMLNYPFDMTFTQISKKALEYVGPDRIMFGSEGGLDVLERNVYLLRAAFTELQVLEEDRNKILGGNISRLIGPG